MKKVLISLVLIVSTILYIPVVNAMTTGDISMSINFDNKDLYSSVEARGITISLYNNGKLLGSEVITKNSNSIGDYKLEVTSNIDGLYITNYNFVIYGLENGEYEIRVSGKNHKEYSTSVEISDYSKHISLSTSNNSFTLGDMDSNNKITSNDLDLVKNSITNFSNSVDVNGDGVVNILDLVIVNKNIGATGDALVLSTNQLTKNENVDISSSLDLMNSTIVGEFSNLFDPNTSDIVTFENTDNNDEIIIPIVFSTPQEMSEIQIDTTSSSGGIVSGYALVEYEENGIEYSRYVYFGSSSASSIKQLTTDDSNTIVISLGNRVVVKTITVTVTQVVADDDSISYAVVENVNFIVDIVPENPLASDGIIENLTASAGDSLIKLEWDKVLNVSGYRVSYGMKDGVYTYSSTTSTNSITLSGLENLENYYIVVNALSGDWAGTTSQQVVAKPMPSSVPTAPTSISVTEEDMILKLSWLEVKNAVGYNIYLRENNTNDELVKYTTTSTSISINALENDVEYEVYVAAYNSIGEGSRTRVLGTPFKIDVEAPLIPTLDKIPSSNITNIVMSNSSNVNLNLQPTGTFDVSWVADDDYSTFWVADVWYKSSAFTFTFDQAYDMSYLVYVTKMESKYALSLEDYHIRVWQDGDDLSTGGDLIEVNTAVERYTDENGNIYHVFPFEKTENVKQITVQALQWDGSYTNISLSEIIFYEHNGIDNEIDSLFEDSTFTKITSDVTSSQLDNLEQRLNDSEGYVIDRNILLKEVELARSLLEGNSLVGYVKDDFVSIDTSNESGTFFTYSPLGIVGLARYDLMVYASIPEGESLYIYPSQYYATSSSILGNAIELTNGRNIISVQDLTNIYGATEGGEFYYKYSGDKADEIVVHFYLQKGIFQGVDIFSDIIVTPTLELYDYTDLVASENEVKLLIEEYINNLTDHMDYEDSKYIFNPNTDSSLNPVNSTEISLNGVLLSLPATEVYNGLSGDNISEQVNNLYNALLAWEELIYITHYTYGDDLETRGSRQNIRYMRMSDYIFMYAAGNHIGVGYGSTKALVQGSPTSITGEGSNSLYGWGIAHEIGHNLDRMGILEVTNNIYSQLVMTYDSNMGFNPGRISFSSIYEKTAVGGAGVPNNVFTQLGMYWQLQQAYATEEQLEFYRSINLAYKSGEFNSFSGNNKFAVIASSVAGKDLTEFFTQWGFVLSSSALEYMSQFDEETRKIQYFDDNSRKYRLLNNTGITSVVNYSVTASVSNNSTITLNINHSYNEEDLLGFQISRNGESIAFVTTNTYSEVLGSINNKALEYSVLAIDKLGNVIGNEVLSNQVKIEYDETIDKSNYTVSEIEDGFKFTFTNSHITSGISIDNAPSNGNFEVLISADNEEYQTVKSGDFTISDSTTKFLNYFNKVGVDSTDTRIASYDTLTIIVTGIDNADDVSFISYVGDMVSFTDYTIGILGHDFDIDPSNEYADNSDIIKAGSVILVGEYRGDPYFNEITINGRFVNSSTVDNEELVERLFSGTTYMFSEVFENNVVSTISDGLFIFVPDIQAEAELAGHESCGHLSVFPYQFQAIMKRVDSSGEKYETSNTIWYNSATYESLPTIILE